MNVLIEYRWKLLSWIVRNIQFVDYNASNVEEFHA